MSRPATRIPVAINRTNGCRIFLTPLHFLGVVEVSEPDRGAKWYGLTDGYGNLQSLNFLSWPVYLADGGAQ